MDLQCRVYKTITIFKKVVVGYEGVRMRESGG